MGLFEFCALMGATVAALGVLLAVAVLALECLAALWLPPRAGPTSQGARPGTVVLVPAHDEAGTIGAVLRCLSEELGEGDRILVVAHNCTDETVSIARSHGADVAEG